MTYRPRMGRARSLLLASCAAIAMTPALAHAETVEAAKPVYFSIPAQDLGASLNQFARQSEHQIVFSTDIAVGRAAPALQGELAPEQALAMLLAGTDLTWRRQGDAYMITRASDPQSGSAAGDGADGTVQALIVTAQKREEDIQDVPIAISAFTQEDLTRSQVAGGPDLMTQVPNMTFTKTNFTSYSIQIRGIGTQAISATTDPAVAVAFNNTPFVRNHFFEQEFYDLQRVEVLRGPQGTLYGRNATAGVVNVISAKPKFSYEAKISADLSNYNSSRLEGMVNVPLVDDKVALRIAGAWTKRDGYAFNEITDAPIDGRDLWSTRVTLRVTPNDAIDANLIWEHFEENDDRLRSGKQLCKTDEITEFAGFPTTHYQTLPEYGQSLLFAGVQGSFSQGCAPSSLYSPDSFQTPEGIALPYYVPLSAVFLPAALDDPYVSRGQSHDLRVIESTVEPQYKAKADVAELQVSVDLSDRLTLSSETAWASDFIFSMQDLNRFNTASGAWEQLNPEGLAYRPGILDDLSPAGYPQFCDPQIGCADRLVALDLATATSQQFSQELRLASNYEGPFNFSLGANFLRYDTVDKYYVFINSLSIISAVAPYGTVDPLPPYVVGETDNSFCLRNGPIPLDPTQAQQILGCTYIDPNPVGALNDLGHNYFLSKNPYKLISYAVFGEAYYKVADNLKITAGLRWTVDKKEAPLIPSWILASSGAGYPVAEVVEQEWREPTGRLAVDWKPDLSFTDETLVYGSYAHGYKAGGANPPTYGKAIYSGNEAAEILINQSVVKPKTFEPEFVDAFELGAKNTLDEGRMTLNLAAFYYDYKDYQISQIVDRSASNLNFDADIWGAELEANWRPLENLRFGLKLGYENTRVADGERAIDIMDRTAGNEAWTVYRPFPSIPSNCVLPKWLFIGHLSSSTSNPELVNVGGRGGGNPGGCELSYIFGYDPATGAAYTPNPGSYLRNGVNYADWSTDPAMYPGWPVDPVTGQPIPISNGMDYPGWNPKIDYGNNHGEGFFKDLSGNELPNAPDYTATLTVDYSLPLPNDWLMTLHSDLYMQSEAWTRIFNTEGYDKLKAYTNVNLAAIFTNEAAGWNVMAYVKNVFDRDSITGAFLFSDDTGLTTNVFLTEPRLYGLRVTKEWTGGPWWTGANPDHPAGEPYPLTIEIGGQVQRHDAPYVAQRPSFAGQFSEKLDIFTAMQNRDLDWGDGREVKLTWRPVGSRWNVSAAARFGDTNRGDRVVVGEPGDCDPKYVGPGSFADGRLCNNNWSEVFNYEKDDYTLADFMVGRDVGIGSLRGSSVSVGLRYAEFTSRTNLKMSGVPDANLPKYAFLGTPVTHHRYDSNLATDRDFKGAGPAVNWEAALPLWDDGDAGHLDVDWLIGAGVLFGKQDTSVAGDEIAKTYTAAGFSSGALGTVYWTNPDVVTPTSVNHARSQNVTVPTANLSMGLSYGIQRIKLSTGYRWERYFNVLDGGFAEHKDADRTIDGPYFKIAVGFGG